MSKPNIEIKDDYAELKVNADIYSKETVYAVGYVFLDKAYILLDSDKDYIVVYLYAKDGESDLENLALEFCNELMNYAHYFSRAENNAEAVKALMQRALFSAAPEYYHRPGSRTICRDAPSEHRPQSGWPSRRSSRKGPCARWS